MASYLDRIQFDPNLRNSLHGKYVTNFRLVFLLIVSIFVIGIVNYLDIPRRLNPEVDIPIVTISTLLPGASPEEVEALVTIPLEDELKSVENLDQITSTSRDNLSIIVLQFLSTVETDKARSDTQQIVDAVTDLPTDAETPRVNSIDFENQPVWTFALTSKDTPSLMSLSENLKKDLERLRQISEVQVSGFETQEIRVGFDRTKIAEYGISPLQLSQTIRTASQAYPAGTVKSNSSSFALSIDPEVTTVDDIRNIRISTANAVVLLQDIAEIKEVSESDQNKTWFADQNTQATRAVQFFVYKSASSNIDAASKAAVQRVEEFVKPYEGRAQLVSITNSGEQITKQFEDLVREFGTTVILIFMVLLVFLGLRQAIISSFTVPLTFLSAIAIANAFGQSLNFLTLFSFLIALGLLIDDTIVVVTAMTRYYGSGKFTAQETGLLVWRDFFIPLWSTTATTVWSFVPLLLATGIIGEFIKPIPIIITATMMSSTAIACLVTLPLMIVFLKPSVPRRIRILFVVLGILILGGMVSFILPKNAVFFPLLITGVALGVVAYSKRKSYLSYITERTPHGAKALRVRHVVANMINDGVVHIESVSYSYRRVLKNILNSNGNRRNVVLFLIFFSITSFALVPLGFVKNEFFPKTDEETLYISVSLPPGNTIQETSQEALRLAEHVRDTEEVRYIVVESGFGFTGQLDRENDPASFLITLALTAIDERDKTSIQIAGELRERLSMYDRGVLNVVELSGGPPAGADVQISLLGSDLALLDQYANRVMAHLKENPGVTNVDSSFKPGTSKIVFTPDSAKLASSGISRDQLGLWLRTYASGFTLDTIRIEDDIDIRLEITDGSANPEDLSSIVIPTPSGNVPLMALGTFSLGANPTSIAREDTLRSITVTATVQTGFNSSDINTKLEQFTQSLELPSGYRFQTGGVNEENTRSVNSILQAMILSFLLILITMVIEFKSYRQATIVMLTIPLAISGVFYIFALTGTPLSFPALIGILALFGIVVTNAIVVIDKINSNRAEGMELKEAILDGAGSRLEPVLLTSLTTIFGLLPITLSDPLWRGLGGAIISGLFFSGLIKLFFIPVVYYQWYREKKS